MSDPSPPQQSPPSPPPDFPPIEPSNFDLIVIGTSLPNSILTAASSSAAKTVLHLDPNPFYGSLFSTLSPPDLSSFLSPPPPPPSPPSLSSDDFTVVPITTRPLLSAVESPPLPPEFQPHVRKLAVDVSGPRVLFSADAAIELLLNSGVSHYLEFKAVEESLMYDGGTGQLVSVPDSKAGIFKDKGLSLRDKLQLNKFFKSVQQHLSRDSDKCFSEEELESPFFEFLSKQGLPEKIKGIILYGIALADHDQENVEAGKDLLRTKDGISRLALYHLSMGRFPNAPGAMLYPMYGQGELPQAFCRRAAVKGCIYVLRISVAALLADKDTGAYRGVRLSSGQDVFSQKLILDPDVVVPEALASSYMSEDPVSTSNHPCSKDMKKKVARAICITKTSLKADASNLLIVLPPRSLYPEQATSIRALQMSSNSAVCPMGMFVVHLSALCDDANQGETLLKAAIGALFRKPTSGSTNDNSAEDPKMNSDAPSAVQEEQRPVCNWWTLYIQEITEGSVHTISTTPSPDGNLSYSDLIDATETMFQQMFPGEEYFPKDVSPEDTEDSETGDPE